MSYTEIQNSAFGDNATTFADYTVPALTTDGAGAQKETEWVNTRAGDYLGYYKKIPEIKIAIDTKAAWTIGKGFKAHPLTELALSVVNGIGNDTFNSIIENAIRCYNIYGDAFLEIIRDGDKLVNLKPLDPSTITVISNKAGQIIKYKQVARAGQTTYFKPEDMLHLARNRVADEVHGISLIESVEWIILARNEAMSDYKKLLHRNIYPVRIWHLDTDRDAKIADFKAKVATSKYQGEDIFIPKGSVQTELATVSQNASLDPKSWIQLLNNYFYQAVGVPQIIIGGSQELTQTAAQIAYLAFEQVIEEEQRYVEEQILRQLNLEIELEFPASLQSNAFSSVTPETSLATQGGATQGLGAFQQFNQPSKFSPPLLRQNAKQGVTR